MKDPGDKSKRESYSYQYGCHNQDLDTLTLKGKLIKNIFSTEQNILEVEWWGIKYLRHIVKGRAAERKYFLSNFYCDLTDCGDHSGSLLGLLIPFITQ